MNVYLPALAALLLAHLIGDFPLQTNRIFRWKLQSNLGILLHVVIHLLVTALLLQEPEQFWLLLVWLGVIHFGIDWLKLRIPVRHQAPGFVIDQMAHLISLLGLAMAFPEARSHLPLWFIYSALVYSLIPVTIMLIWVIMGDMARTQPDFAYSDLQPAVLRWSQRTGWVLIVGVLFVTGARWLTGTAWGMSLTDVVLRR